MAWVALFSTLAGLLYGAWVDGASLLLIVGYLAGFLALLAAGLYAAPGAGQTGKPNRRRSGLKHPTERHRLRGGHNADHQDPGFRLSKLQEG